ncbi:unnamed protein product [Didymodactylos carnosus]|uniref:Uncharacterized protein n=1 Tax=Didymodactylos carnosus TaxID=1234261 RepID=A0A814S7A9_9BILA|nr:unnamed protein product [Didymodactylos carnosus]CAF3907224.1 unnamed protein product [Didymodactylos carnosus]
MKPVSRVSASVRGRKGPLSSNVEARFSPRTNIALSSLPISELIDFHKNRERKHMKYAIGIFAILGLIGLVLLIVSFALPKSNGDIDQRSSKRIVFLIIGSTLLGMGLFMALVAGGCIFYKLKQQFNDLNEIEGGQEPIIWRLDGEEWVRYLNYMHGPNRRWTEMAPLSCFCCRRSAYDRLMDRQYGHIVFYGKGLIIDELYFISFRTYLLQGVQLLVADQQQQRLGLRIHTFLQAGKNSRNCYFDVFSPSSVTLEQLQAIIQSYNQRISGPDGLHTVIEGLHVAASIVSLLS